MAGGEFARDVACMVCLDDRVLTRAQRIYEGDETDRYRCENGHDFGMDWLDPATEAQWPPPADILAGLND
jgi:hypothetical protein